MRPKLDPARPRAQGSVIPPRRRPPPYPVNLRSWPVGPWCSALRPTCEQPDARPGVTAQALVNGAVAHRAPVSGHPTPPAGRDRGYDAAGATRSGPAGDRSPPRPVRLRVVVAPLAQDETLGPDLHARCYRFTEALMSRRAVTWGPASAATMTKRFPFVAISMALSLDIAIKSAILVRCPARSPSQKLATI